VPTFYLIGYFIPASYYINITRGIILRGAGLSHLWLDGLALYAMAPFFFSSPPAGSRTKLSWREFSPA
jgi:ABC-type multidrug transport system permease subunit